MLGAVALSAIALYAVVCAIAGFGPIDDTINTFRPALPPLERRFAGDPARVMAAFERAVPGTPGLRLADRSADTMLLDLRPTSRILGGGFGLVIRIRFAGTSAAETEVSIDARKKVSFAVAANPRASLLHAERALRMKAKQHGIEELV